MEKEWDAQKYYEMGVFYFTRQEYRRAKAEFLMSIKQDPHFAKGYVGAAFASFRLGNAHYLDKDFDKCTQEHNLAGVLFLNAIKENPKYEEAYYGLGVLYFIRWQLEKKIEYAQQARVIFEKAKELDPERALTYYYLGIIYASDNNFPEAKKNLKRYLELKPDAENKQIVLDIINAIEMNKPTLPVENTENELLNSEKMKLE